MAGILTLAWRNLGRNRRRTAATGVALAIGVSLSVASYGLADGMSVELLTALTRFDLGHIQLHAPAYPTSRALRDTLHEPDALMATASAQPGVTAAAPRIYAFALLSRDGNSLGAQLVGVDPTREPRVTTLQDRIVAGRYLDDAATPWPRGRALTRDEASLDAEITDAEEAAAIAEIEALAGDRSGAAPTAPAAPALPEAAEALTAQLADTLSPPPERPPRVVVGAVLARLLDAQVGDTFHATGQTVDGTTEEVFFEIAGIYHTGTAALDRSRVYLHITDAQRFIHAYDAVHEIALTTATPGAAAAIARALSVKLGDGVLVRSWDEIRPDIRQMIDLSTVSTGVMVFIIFLVATLGVVNTMLMAVFDRTRELGMLKAIGMSSRRIVALIVTETLLLVLVCCGIGTAIGLGFDLVLVYHGLDLSAFTGGFSVGGVGVNPVIHGAITAHGLIVPTVVLATTCLFASLYPALRAARLAPAVGMRET